MFVGPRHFLLAFLLVCSTAVATPKSLEHLQSHLDEINCEQFLKGDLHIPAEPPTPPLVPGYLSTWGQVLTGRLSALKERRELRRQAETIQSQIEDYEAFQRQNVEARRQALTTLNEIRISSLDPRFLDQSFTALAKLLLDKGKQLVKESRHPIQTADIMAFVEEKALALRKASDDLKLAKKTWKNQLKKQLDQSYGLRIQDQIREDLDSAWDKLKEADDIQSAEVLLKEVLDQARTRLMEFARTERQRRIREMRYPPESPASASLILSSLRTLAPEVSFEAFSDQIVRDPKLRGFLQLELQFVRRLSGTASQSELVTKRLQNDLRAVGENRVHSLVELRQALVRLQPLGLRRLSLSEREQVIKDALASQELTTSLLTSVQDLPTRIEVSPPPVEPSRRPPSKPFIPRTFKSQSQHRQVQRDIENYNDEVRRFQKKWSDYKSQADDYRDHKIPAYHRQIEDLKLRYAQRARSQHAVRSYFAATQPQTLRDQEWARKLNQDLEIARTQAARLPNSRQQQTVSQYTSLPPSSSSSDEFLLWMIYYQLFLAPSHPTQASEILTSVPDVNLNLPAESQLDSEHSEFKPIPTVEVPAPDVQIPELPDIQIPDLEIPDLPDIQIPDPPSIPDAPTDTGWSRGSDSGWSSGGDSGGWSGGSDSGSSSDSGGGGSSD